MPEITCREAIRRDDLVLFLEHKMIYGNKGEVPEDDYTIPLGKAAARRGGHRRRGDRPAKPQAAGHRLHPR